MARPLRIEFPGAVYHITNRGNERKEIFRINVPDTDTSHVGLVGIDDDNSDGVADYVKHDGAN